MSALHGERSVAEVRVQIDAVRRERDAIVSRQTFYCKHRKKLTSPAECHDCFARMPYLERLSRWDENRMKCIEVHCVPHPQKERDETDAPFPLTELAPKDKGGGEGPTPSAPEHYSIEEYLSRGMLEFLLDADVLAERFEGWWMGLADAARTRVHDSAQTQEMILWLVQRLETFKRLVLLTGRRPAEINTREKRRNNVG
jgi:hypothetical protein